MKISITDSAREMLSRLLRDSKYTRPGVRIRVTGVG